MSRTIASSVGKLLTEPDGGLLTGTLKFVLEGNTLNSPAQTYGEIAVVNGEYSGTVAVGVYTINFVQYADTYRLGTSIAINDGAAIDILTLVGLAEVPTSAADLILAEMQTLADQTAADAVATDADAVSTAADVIAAQASADAAAASAVDAASAVLSSDSYTLNAISAALTGPSSVVAVAAFSVADDADGGAWVDKMAHTSWEQEVGKFPRNFTVVVESAKLWIFDNSDGSVWMSFTAAGAFGTFDTNIVRAAITLTNIAYANGIIYLTSDNASGRGGLTAIDFIQDTSIIYRTSSDYNRYGGNISERNSGKGHYPDVSVPKIVDQTCNAVAVTALDGAPLDYALLPTNTSLVMTSLGPTWLTDDGSAWDGTGGIVTIAGDITSDGYSFIASASKLYCFHSIPSADIAMSSADYIFDTAATSGPWIHGTIQSVKAYGLTVYVGTSTGLFEIKYNPATPASGMVAYTTNTYATPYMKGDVEVCLDGSSLTDRSVTGTVITDNGTATFTVVNGGDLKYTTASGGTITAPVTTGGECYGWERVGGVWVFRSSISEWVGVSEAAGTLTIADGTIFTRLVYVNGAAPSSEQLSEIERTDTALFASGAAMLLPGASSAVLDLGYNEARDELTVTQADYVATFRDLVRVDSVASQVGTLTSAAADRGVLVQGGSTGAHLAAEAVDVKAELAAANQRIAELGRALPPYTIVGSSTTTVALPAGQRAVPGAVIFSGSSLLHEGAANDWTQNTDGYIWTVTFAVAQTGNISIPVERAA